MITDAFRVLGKMIKHFNMDAAKQSWQSEHGHNNSNLRWDDRFVDEVKRALVACKVFCFYPIYWAVYGQFTSNSISQAAQMELHGIPNDLMPNFDAISIIVFIPICELLVYPLMRKRRIPFKPITRISLGFIVASMSMVYAAIVQHLIYSAGPCYESPLCAASWLAWSITGTTCTLLFRHLCTSW